jgi:hypothetical protein
MLAKTLKTAKTLRKKKRALLALKEGRGVIATIVAEISKARGVDTRTPQAFMGHRSIANTVVYTAVTDKRIRNIWGK